MRVFGVDEFKLERQSPVRRQRSSHREQVGRGADTARERDEVGGVGQRSEQTVGVALRTQERPSLALYVAMETNKNNWQQLNNARERQCLSVWVIFAPSHELSGPAKCIFYFYVAHNKL